jgi:hypothetical protein
MLTLFLNFPHCSQTASKIKHRPGPKVLLFHHSFIFLTLDATTLYHCEAPSSEPPKSKTVQIACDNVFIFNFFLLYIFPFLPSFTAIAPSLDFLKPTGYVMHQQFNIQQLYALPTLYLRVLYLSDNKQRLVPLTA